MTQVNGEWACLVNKMDGTRQTMVGVDCPKITSTFPNINTSVAVNELVASAPDEIKPLVSSLKVPVNVGGDPDLLLGIHYEACHPVILHTLSSGLFIAQLKLESSEGYTACIGGPHKSFVALSGQVGDTARLMSCFVDGLKNYQSLGAPRLPAAMLTLEDIEFAQKMNSCEMKSIAELKIDEVDDDSRAGDEQVDYEEQVVEVSVDGDEDVPVDDSEFIAVDDEQVKEVEVSVTAVDADAGDQEVDVHSDDGDVEGAPNLEADGVKVTVHESVSVFSDPIGAEVGPTEVEVDPINAEIVPFDAAVVPFGENLRLSLYHRNRTKQGKTVIARVMSDLKSDKVEPFSEGEDVAKEIESPDVENEIDVFNAVLLENEEDCDAAHLYIYSDAGEVPSEADLVFVQLDDDGSNILASLETSQNQSSIDYFKRIKGLALHHSQVGA